MNEVPSPGRKAWVAAVLSLLAPGLGYVYAGRIVNGLVLFFAYLASAPLLVLAAALPPSTAVLVLMVGVVVGVIVLDLYGVIDSWRVARRAGPDYALKDYNRPVVYALFLAAGLLYPAFAFHYVRANAFEAFYVPAGSMVPTVLNGDHILVNKAAYRNHGPERGDVIVFRYPRQPGYQWVKRVVALPGDSVEVRGHDVSVNGKKLERDRVPAVSLAPLGGQLTGEVFEETNGGRRYRVMLAAEPAKGQDVAKATVPDGACFVLGDDRDNSKDSRSAELGFVPLGDVLGRVSYVHCPAATWERFGPLRN
jgi:signal peptidase I